MSLLLEVIFAGILYAIFVETLEHLLVLFKLVKGGLFLVHLRLFKLDYLVLLEAIDHPGKVSPLLTAPEFDLSQPQILLLLGHNMKL